MKALILQLTLAQIDTILWESHSPLEVFLECNRVCHLDMRGTPYKNICRIVGQRKYLEKGINCIQL